MGLYLGNGERLVDPTGFLATGNHLPVVATGRFVPDEEIAFDIQFGGGSSHTEHVLPWPFDVVADVVHPHRIISGVAAGVVDQVVAEIEQDGTVAVGARPRAATQVMGVDVVVETEVAVAAQQRSETVFPLRMDALVERLADQAPLDGHVGDPFSGNREAFVHRPAGRAMIDDDLAFWVAPNVVRALSSLRCASTHA